MSAQKKAKTAQEDHGKLMHLESDSKFVPQVESLRLLAAKACRELDDKIPDGHIKDSILDDLEEPHRVVRHCSFYGEMQKSVGPDSRVLIHGLDGDSAEDNWRWGDVISKDDASVGWIVQLRGSGSPTLLCVKPQNVLKIEQIPRDLPDTVMDAETFSRWCEEGDWNSVRRKFHELPCWILSRRFQIRGLANAEPQLLRLVDMFQCSATVESDAIVGQHIRNFIEGNASLDNTEDQKLNARDCYSARWFLLFQHVDRQEWPEALDCLCDIKQELNVGVFGDPLWVPFPYFWALIEFGMKNQYACKIAIKSFEEESYLPELHSFSVELLNHWVDKSTPMEFVDALQSGSNLEDLSTMLCVFWRDDPLIANPWLTYQVAKDLTAEYECVHGPDSIPLQTRNAIDDLRRAASNCDVTNRYRRARANV